MVRLSRFIHLVKNLGTKMLLGMDILGPEGAVVDLPAQRLRLGESISRPLKIKSLGRRPGRVVQAAKQTTINPFTIGNVPIRLHKLSAQRPSRSLFQTNADEETVTGHVMANRTPRNF